MKVFITGGTGFIGSHIVLELLAAGDEVTILVRNPSKIPEFMDMSGLTITYGDLMEMDAIQRALEGHHACIHNAIIWDDEPTELQLKDTLASVRVFEAAAYAGVDHLIYTSSTAVHRPFTTLMDDAQRITTTDFYGATKAATEVFLSAFSYQTAMRCNIIRPGPTVGVPVFKSCSLGRNNRIEAMVRSAIQGEDIQVSKGDGRQFIGVMDLAKVYSALLHSDRNRETYVAVAQNITTWEEIAQRIVEAIGSGKVAVSEASSENTECLFDVTKLERELGFAFDSKAEMEAGIRSLVDQSSPIT